MPKKLEEALARAYEKKGKKFKKRVDKGRYIYGSDAMQDYMKKKHAK